MSPDKWTKYLPKRAFSAEDLSGLFERTFLAMLTMQTELEMAPVQLMMGSTPSQTQGLSLKCQLFQNELYCLMSSGQQAVSMKVLLRLSTKVLIELITLSNLTQTSGLSCWSLILATAAVSRCPTSHQLLTSRITARNTVCLIISKLLPKDSIYHMLVTQVRRKVLCVRGIFRVSNIRKGTIQKSMEGLRTSFPPSIRLGTLEEHKQEKVMAEQQFLIHEAIQEPLNPSANNHSQTAEKVLKSQAPPPDQENSSQLRILHQKNIGLNLFINRVYITTGASIMMALGTLHVASSIPYFTMNPLMCIGYGTLMTVAGLFSSYYIRPHIVVEAEEGYQHVKTRNGLIRTSLFVMGWMGVGLTSMPFSNMVSSLMPMLVPNLMAMTVGCFGGASLLIASMPRMPLFTYGGLIGGLAGSLLSMRVMRSFHAMIYGQHFMSNFVQTLDMYVGTSVFTFFIVYNTIKAKQAYEAGNSDHLEISIRFYYDMLKYLQRLFHFLFRKKVD